MAKPTNSAGQQRFDTGALLRELRGKMSREEFAELFDVSSSTVVRYESNERVPDAEFLLRLNVRHGLDPLYVLTGRRSETALIGNERELIQNYRAADAPGKKLIEDTATLAARAAGRKAA